MNLSTYHTSLLLVTLVTLLSGTAVGQGGARPASTMSQLPIYFLENRGQLEEQVRYYVQGSTKNVYFTRTGITFELHADNKGWATKLDFVEANPDATLVAGRRAEAVFSYFKGEPSEWNTGIGSFRKIVYQELWKGIDLVYSGHAGQLKYEFVVKPGADPARIRLRYRGIDKLEVTRGGALRVCTPAGSFEDDAPQAYQMVGETREAVDMGFALDPVREKKNEKENEKGMRAYGFTIGGYDQSKTLILDPAVHIYCGYIGGTDYDVGYGIDIDAAGNAYVAGWTRSSEMSFPVVVGPFLTHSGGGADAFVAKVDPTGMKLLYCGYIGGTDDDRAMAICVDKSGAAYVTGGTKSSETSFPVMGSLSPTKTGFDYDGWVAKVAPSGRTLVYCGYIGGVLLDYGYGIAVDTAGRAHVTGWSYSSPTMGFPVKGGPSLVFGGLSDAFVAKVDATGSSFLYCGYIGGLRKDYGLGIEIDAAGYAVMVGYAASDQATFPVRGGPDLTHNGGVDTFVAKLTPAGTTLVFCGYIGGMGSDYGYDLDLDSSGALYIVGYTDSTETTFPVKTGPDTTYNGGLYDTFVAKVTATGASLSYCGYVGGSADDRGRGIGVDAKGRAVITGETFSSEASFPVRRGPDSKYDGFSDGYVAMISSSGTGPLVYCGYIGGSALDEGKDVVVNAEGRAYITGKTYSSTAMGFPAMDGPDMMYNGGPYDAFVTMVVDGLTLWAANTHVIFVATGGSQRFSLDAGKAHANKFYIVAGSATGTTPGFTLGGVHVPLNPDAYTDITIAYANTPVFMGFRGTLDANGQATASLNVPGGIGPITPFTLHHAYIVHDATGKIYMASDPVHVLLK